MLFTGAGTSAEAGIPTFRTDQDSFWSVDHPMEVANIFTFRRNACGNRETSRVFHNKLRQLVSVTQPTAFHHAVRRWQIASAASGHDFHVITQNVDDLFEKAGVENVQKVHGDIRYLQCLAYNHRWFVGYEAQEQDVRCPQCNCGVIKSGTVFFDEDAPLYPTVMKLLKSLTNGDVLLVLGTSCTVFPLEQFLRNTRPFKVFNALEMPEGIDPVLFDKVYLEPCTSAIGKIRADVDAVMADHLVV